MAARVFVQGTPAYRNYKLIGWGLFIVFLILIAFAYADTGQLTILDNKYALSIPRINKALSFSIAILGLQVVVGYTGQLALGQSFFFGTGAYLAAWLVADHNWSWFSTLIVIIPVCFVLGFLLGIPALRIKGLYLALVTLGLAAIFPSVVQLEQLEEYTAGAAGKTTDSDLVPPSWLPLDGIANALQKLPLIGDYFGDGDLSSREANRVWIYFIFVVTIAVLVWLISNMLRSRPGRAIRAIRDNETSAAVSGVNLALYKTIAFGISTAIGGIGGMMYVAELGIASPGDFTQLLSIFFIVGLVTGGVGTNSGAVLGGLIIAFVPEWSSSTEELPIVPERWLQGPTGTFIMGVLLVALMFVLPGGIVAGMRRLKARFVRLVPAPPKGYEHHLAPTPGEPAAASTVTEDAEADAADATTT